MMRGHYNPGMLGMHGYGYNIWFILLLIAVVVAIIVGVMLLIKYSRNNTNVSSASSVSSAPFDIIKERLAKGEIDAAEYEQLKEKLKEK